MLARLAQESGIETPTAEDLARLDRKDAKKLSNQDWVSKSDPEAKSQDEDPYKPEHAVDLTPARWWPPSYGRRGRPTTPGRRWRRPRTRRWTRPEDPADPTGYHSRSRRSTRPLEDGSPSPSRKVLRAGTCDGAARRAVTNNRTRLLSGVAKEAFKLRAEIVERSFAHGGMRRTWLAGARTCTSDSMSPATI